MSPPLTHTCKGTWDMSLLFKSLRKGENTFWWENCQSGFKLVYQNIFKTNSFCSLPAESKKSIPCLNHCDPWLVIFLDSSLSSHKLPKSKSKWLFQIITVIFNLLSQNAAASNSHIHQVRIICYGFLCSSSSNFTKVKEKWVQHIWHFLVHTHGSVSPKGFKKEVLNFQYITSQYFFFFKAVYLSNFQIRAW